MADDVRQIALNGIVALSLAGTLLGGSQNITFRKTAKEEDTTTLADDEHKGRPGIPSTAFDLAGFVAEGETALAVLSGAMDGLSRVTYDYTDGAGNLAESGEVSITSLEVDTKVKEVITYKIACVKGSS